MGETPHQASISFPNPEPGHTGALKGRNVSGSRLGVMGCCAAPSGPI